MKHYPDGNILKKDKDVNVHLRHEDLDIYSNTSIFFQKENSVISYGKVKLIQVILYNFFAIHSIMMEKLNKCLHLEK